MNNFEVHSKLKVPEDFAFPYTPYPMQLELMRSLYQVLEDKGVGIFESPTGTGKSLTLTCAALHWLEDHENLVREDLLERITQVETEIKTLEAKEATTTDWINAQHQANEKRNDLRDLLQFREHLDERKNHLATLRARRLQQKRQNKRTRFENLAKIKADLVSVESEGDESSEDENIGNEDVGKENRRHQDVQIFFCSRTHTQLTQVLREVKRTIYGSRVRCVTLASRQQLCIHPEVRKLGSLSAINERCLDMTRNKNKPLVQINAKQNKQQQVKKCPYKAQTAVDELMAAVLTDVLDIEELVNEAGLQQACPYYAARAATPDAQLVFLSYQMLLHKRTREQCGIDLRGSIIIIDEGHNLLDTIAEMNSCTCTLMQMRSSVAKIKAYKKKHLQRFTAANLLKINQLLYVIHRLESALILNTGKDQEMRVYKTYELMSDTDISDVDLFQLLSFCEKRHLVQKLQYAKIDAKYEYSDNTIRPVLTFLEALTENAKDGRVLMNIADPDKSCYKYTSLNPARHFEEVVSNARAVIVAGGTMQPTLELKTQLFACNPERVREYFYDHVVPSNAVKCFLVTHGPKKIPLHLNFKNRLEHNVLSELGTILSHLYKVIPGGLVVFFPSYEFLKVANEVFIGLKYIQWDEKHILKEEKESHQTTEDLLKQYKMLTKSPKGALLMAVVGGKLSEGLDFKDDLGRGVVVVGLPYPYRNSPELKERMQYLDKKLGPESGEIYYENLCLKAVNQCIGRAVRHINDYACVYLIDQRYSQLRIQNKLPQWIRRSIQATDSINIVVEETAKFFEQKQNVNGASF